jgi:hypothetical protein
VNTLMMVALAGTIGEAAAKSMSAFICIGRQAHLVYGTCIEISLQRLLFPRKYLLIMMMFEAVDVH